MILAGGAGTRLDILSKHRAKPAVPFGGKYRIIDFPLSNCVNSNIYTIAVLTQYLPRSLHEHIGIGRSWDLDRKFGGIELLAPFQGKEGDWYNGTAHAVFKNMSYFIEKNADNVIILSGDHIYKMNYQKMIREHENNNADLTIAVKPVEWEMASEFGILSVNDEGRITEFEEKPAKPKSNLASMGIYIFKASALEKVLIEFCGEKGLTDFGKDIIPAMIENMNVFGYRFEDYWRDVGTLEEYWKANMELLERNPPLNLYDRELSIYTRHPEVPPARFGENSSVVKSIVSGGCLVDGRVENSVLCSEVIVEEGAVIRNSIILDRAVIKKGTIIDRTIVDKDAVIGANSVIGYGEDYTINVEKPKNLYTGLNLIGKFAEVPDGTIIQRNCRIKSRAKAVDFKSNIVKSGETVNATSDTDPLLKYR
jgi:glucose-1-phosphate adenylyltransferase